MDSVVASDDIKEIQDIYDEYKEIKRFFEEYKQVTYLNRYTSIFTKNFLISCASCLECKMLSTINHNLNPSNCILTSNFINTQLERRFHTLFDWGTNNNINAFLKKFGDEFKDFYCGNNDDEYEKAFITIIAERNILVHENYVLKSLDNTTAEDIKKNFDNAILFIDNFSGKICEFREQKKS